jgi:hypothetical protein
MSGSDPKPRDPVNVETARRAVRHPRLELAFEVGLHLQQLKAEHLRVDCHRVIASTCGGRLLDEVVGLGSLLGEGMDGVSRMSRSRPAMPRMLGRGSVGALGTRLVPIATARQIYREMVEMGFWGKVHP